MAAPVTPLTVSAAVSVLVAVSSSFVSDTSCAATLPYTGSVLVGVSRTV